jgi:hypothetical protein
MVGAGAIRLPDGEKAARWKWVLFGVAAGAERPPRVDLDRRRLTEAGYPVGDLPGGAAGPPADPLCRCATLLGLL